MKWLDFTSEIIKTILLAALIVIPIRTFIFQPFLVRGASMEPNYHQGDYLIVDQLSYRLREPERGEVIVFDSPTPPKRRFIKRIIGLPGETVSLEDGTIYIENGEKRPLEEDNYLQEKTEGDFEVTLDDDEYFTMGDNREASLDSRSWGPLPEENIIGRVSVQLTPFSTLAFK
ncbi:MAG: signal peptidase I [Patescibacteria group bacterium]